MGNSKEGVVFKSGLFPKNFHWGLYSSSFQTEGSLDQGGRGASIWDDFFKYPTQGTNFNELFEADLDILQKLKIRDFNFSLSWSRILPDGSPKSLNPAGIAFYNKIIDACLERGITPWVTVYHWDLPVPLQKKGGWTNRQVMDWFRDYVDICARSFGDRVKHWNVMNEPILFTGAGYYFGKHAPGKKGLKNFLPALHHALLCQAQGANILKFYHPEAEIGSTFSYFPVQPFSGAFYHRKAAYRIDKIFNKLAIEATFGHGYPFQKLPFLKSINKWIKSGDEELMKFPFDFHGIKLHSPRVVKHSLFTPHIHAKTLPVLGEQLKAGESDFIYNAITEVAEFPRIRKIIVVDSGATFDDVLLNGKIQDDHRIKSMQNSVKNISRAMQDGAPVTGYFPGPFTDSPGWTRGPEIRKGLVHIDYKNFQRTVKDSGSWFSKLIEENTPGI